MCKNSVSKDKQKDSYAGRSEDSFSLNGVRLIERDIDDTIIMHLSADGRNML